MGKATFRAFVGAALLAAASWLAAPQAEAAPITYTFTSSGVTGNFQMQGSPNTNFSAQPLTITVTGDTDNITAGNFNSIYNPNMTATFSLGLISGIITEAVRVVRTSSTLTLRAEGKSDFLWLLGSFSSYDLMSDFSATGNIGRQNSGTLATNLGTLRLTAASPGGFGAAAPVVEPPVGVPEPMSLALFGTALVGLGMAARRRRRTILAA